MLLHEDSLFSLCPSLSIPYLRWRINSQQFFVKADGIDLSFLIIMLSMFLITEKERRSIQKKRRNAQNAIAICPFVYHAMPSKPKKQKKNRLLISVICLILSISHFLRNITRSPIQSSHITICSRLDSRCVRSITPLLSRKDLGRDDHGRTNRRSVETRVPDGFGAIHCRSVEARVCKVLVGVARSCSISCRHGAGGEWDCVVVAIRGLGRLVSRRR